MDDIVKRLRAAPQTNWPDNASGMCFEAADEIEGLREAIGAHFLSVHNTIDFWTHVILNDDGELMTVDELMEGDVIVFER